MRRLAFAAAIATSAFLLGSGAQAMPALHATPEMGNITQVAEGCGPGGHRTPYGRCVSNYRRPLFRGCPPGMHPGPYGRCRPNY